MRIPERLRALYGEHGEKVRFLVVGGWNTLFSIGTLWLLDTLLHARLHYTLILTLNWLISVTQNLFTFKLLVFKTNGNWLKEYFRSFVVYAGGFVINFAIVVAIVQLWHWPLVIAQLPAIAISTIISYVGHKYFTYRPAGTD